MVMVIYESSHRYRAVREGGTRAALVLSSKKKKTSIVFQDFLFFHHIPCVDSLQRATIGIVSLVVRNFSNLSM